MTCRPCVVLLLAAAVLAGCDPATPSPPTPTAAPPPASTPSIAALCGPKPFGAEQPPEAWVRFEVTRQQLQVIDGRLLEVLCRQGLWRQGVGFGFNYEGSGAFVMIHPGRSGLTARQILDRLLGRRP
jgi:hypothetical protein